MMTRSFRKHTHRLKDSVQAVRQMQTVYVELCVVGVAEGIQATSTSNISKRDNVNNEQ